MVYYQFSGNQMLSSSEDAEPKPITAEVSRSRYDLEYRKQCNSPTETAEVEIFSSMVPYYAGNVDFDCLALKDPSFRPIVEDAKKAGFLDFQNPDIVQKLTRTVLRVDFDGLELPSLPSSRLCPPIPVRWNYVKWIQDLLDSTNPNPSSQPTPDQHMVKGLDIGTGASGIYAMLACATRPNWSVTGTEMDPTSAASARENFQANEQHLGHRAKVLAVTGETILPENLGQPESEEGTPAIDFVMTNPPFYDSLADMQSSYTGKSAPPSAVCTGSTNEMICPGGDVGFVSRLLEESLRYRESVRWYSAMMGKLSSLQEIVARLKKEGIQNWAVCCVQAGKKTKRWLVAWSFGEFRPANGVARMGELVHAVMPPATAQTIVAEGMGSARLRERVDEIMKGLEVGWERGGEGEREGVMLAKGNVWSRAARRKKHFQKQEEGGEWMDEDGDGVALGVKIKYVDEEVEVWWFRGMDQVIFMSFCAMLRRGLVPPFTFRASSTGCKP